jgi:hypothetical protein
MLVGCLCDVRASGKWQRAASLRGSQSKEIQKVPVTPTKPDSGPEMNKTYCAACPGIGGKGDGPAAEALKVQPADLTLLKQKNEGKFPAIKVSHVVGRAIRSGPTVLMRCRSEAVFRLYIQHDALVKLRIANLTRYIETIQR